MEFICLASWYLIIEVDGLRAVGIMELYDGSVIWNYLIKWVLIRFRLKLYNVYGVNNL